MNLPQQTFVNISGIDRNDGAAIVFVWCQKKGPEDFALLGSGHVLSLPASARPPGIEAGQFSVTILLPLDCSVDDLFVTDDKSGEERLTGVTMTPCVALSDARRDDSLFSRNDHSARIQTGDSAHNSTTWNGSN
jgi:hypothetical protein